MDWYHATQHLARVAQLIYPNDDTLRQTWYTSMRSHLYAGNLEPIRTDLRASSHPQKAHYFETHQHRLHYEQTRLAGLPLGLGTGDSGITQRRSGSGMRWKLVNI